MSKSGPIATAKINNEKIDFKSVSEFNAYLNELEKLLENTSLKISDSSHSVESTESPENHSVESEENSENEEMLVSFQPAQRTQLTIEENRALEISFRRHQERFPHKPVRESDRQLEAYFKKCRANLHP